MAEKEDHSTIFCDKCEVKTGFMVEALDESQNLMVQCSVCDRKLIFLPRKTELHAFLLHMWGDVKQKGRRSISCVQCRKTSVFIIRPPDGPMTLGVSCVVCGHQHKKKIVVTGEQIRLYL